MQNFGLDPARTQKLNAVEQEIAGEQASALGITGRSLESALRDYRHSRGDSAVKKIVDALQALLIQREALGVPFGNVDWVVRTYDIPQEIVSKLGLR